MPVLGFVVALAMAEEGTLQHGFIFRYLMIAGKIRQFIVSIIVLGREGWLPPWDTFRTRMWLQEPRDPKTGAARWRLIFWLIPAILCYAAFEFSHLGPFLGELILYPFPFLANLKEMELQILVDPQFVGWWWILGGAVISSILNYALGEELLFRGVLLPKMRSAFGKWDGVANAV